MNPVIVFTAKKYNTLLKIKETKLKTELIKKKGIYINKS